MKRVALSMWRGVYDWWSPALALDLGTARTRVADRAARVRVEAASVSGDRAALRGGVVVDHGAAVALLRDVLRCAARRVGPGLRVLAGVPSDAAAHEREAVTDALRASGASRVALVPEPLAAAIGAGIDVGGSYAALVVDVGEGVTDAALVANGCVLAASAVRIGCADFRSALARNALHAGDGAALGATAGAAVLGARVDAALEAACGLVRDLPPRRACEVIESGITVTGGGATVPGLAARLEQRTGITVRRAARAHGCVVTGIAAMLPAADSLGLWR